MKFRIATIAHIQLLLGRIWNNDNFIIQLVAIFAMGKHTLFQKFMKKYFNSSIGFFRAVAFVEGLSLLILVFIAMPIKYILGNPSVVKSVGQIHGILFLAFVFLAIKIAAEEEWSFTKTTWKVLVSSFVPFGTFWVDKHILSKIHETKLVSTNK